MIEGGLTANPQDVLDHTHRLAETFKGASQIRVTSELGTDICFDVNDAKWNLDVGCCT